MTATTGKKILFVDDDKDWRRLVTEVLKDAGHNVLAVEGAAQALLQQGTSDLGLIILDLDLGGENGLMLMKHLRLNHPKVPIFLYTGMRHDDETIQRMRRLGAARYLQKGPMGELLDAVDDALK